MVRGLLVLLAGMLLAPFGLAQGVPSDSRGTQAPAPQFEIVSPGPDAYVSGTTILRATLTPPDAATRIVFSVDGKQVCDATSAPFECSWEAGAGVYAHQIRAAADLKAGGRVIKTVRTKALGFAEKVDVDIVQVIATV